MGRHRLDRVVRRPVPERVVTAVLPRAVPALTRCEQRVAELVGEGLTNPQIAGRLYVSPRTVQSHVTHILQKWGYHSRVELALHVQREAMTAVTK
jgi:DNA-binding NarL/FixJ family response regulator